MTDKTTAVSEDEFYELVYTIGKPTFNFLMKRINKEIIDNPDYKSLDINEFFNVIIAIMSGMCANMIRWMQVFYKLKTVEDINHEVLLMSFIKHLSENLKVVVQ